MNTFDDDDVRDRAFALWAEAGKPRGKIDQFWYRAEKELEAERLVVSKDPLPAPAAVVLTGTESRGRF